MYRLLFSTHGKSYLDAKMTDDDQQFETSFDQLELVTVVSSSLRRN
jgi:hypothetical protein